MPNIRQLKFFEQSSYFRQAKEEFTTLISDPLIKKAIQLMIALSILDFGIIAVLWSYFPPQLPLLYSKPWGRDQLVSKPVFLLLPLSCLLFCLINILIAGLVYKKELILSRILVFSSLLVCLLTNIALIKVIIISI